MRAGLAILSALARVPAPATALTSLVVRTPCEGLLSGPARLFFPGKGFNIFGSPNEKRGLALGAVSHLEQTSLNSICSKSDDAPWESELPNPGYPIAVIGYLAKTFPNILADSETEVYLGRPIGLISFDRNNHELLKKTEELKLDFYVFNEDRTLLLKRKPNGDLEPATFPRGTISFDEDLSPSEKSEQDCLLKQEYENFIYKESQVASLEKLLSCEKNKQFVNPIVRFMIITIHEEALKTNPKYQAEFKKYEMDMKKDSQKLEGVEVPNKEVRQGEGIAVFDDSHKTWNSQSFD